MIQDSGVATARPATVHDVAREAGVSAQTVSRLLKGFEHISPSTRERVEAAIERLDYRPNQAARLLRTRKSMRLGAIVHEMFEYGPAQLLRGATARAHDFGYTLSVAGVDGDDQAAIARALEGFEAERVAGVLAVTLTDSVRAALARRPTDVPVLVDPAEAHNGGPALNERGGSLIAEHLLALGHRQVGVVSGPGTWLPARQRTEAFIDRVADAGGSCSWQAEGDWSARSGAAAAEAFPAEAGITGVFAGNDSMAVGFIHGLISRGIGVPEDVSVVGFDDLPESVYLRPALTTFRPDFEAQGRLAVEALLGVIDGDEPATTGNRTNAGYELVPRGSSAAIRHL